MIFYDVLITERIHCLSVRHTHTWATADWRTEYQKTLADKCEYYVPDTIFVYAISCSSLALEKAVTQLVCPPLLQTTAFQTIGSFAEKFCQERISAIIWLFLQGHQWVNILVYPAQFVYINKMDWHKWKTSAGVELKKSELTRPL